jgi:hypothetical protein
MDEAKRKGTGKRPGLGLVRFRGAGYGGLGALPIPT